MSKIRTDATARLAAAVAAKYTHLTAAEVSELAAMPLAQLLDIVLGGPCRLLDRATVRLAILN